MNAVEMQPIYDLIKQMQDSNATLGLLGVVSVLVYGVIRIYRLPWIQRFMPDKAKWDNWSNWVRMAVLFGAAFVAQFLAGVAAGTKWYQAFLPALMAGLGAIGLRQVEKNATGNAQTIKP